MNHQSEAIATPYHGVEVVPPGTPEAQAQPSGNLRPLEATYNRAASYKVPLPTVIYYWSFSSTSYEYCVVVLTLAVWELTLTKVKYRVSR